MSGCDEEAAALCAELRARGWYVRTTEWPSGHQVVLHRREDTSRHVVTDWHASEVDAFREALALALRHAEGTGSGRGEDRPPDGECRSADPESSTGAGEHAP